MHLDDNGGGITRDMEKGEKTLNRKGKGKEKESAGASAMPERLGNKGVYSRQRLSAA